MPDNIDYGWVRLHRKIKKNPIWNIKPYSKGQAWMELIMSANHEPAQVILGNEILNIERGQFHTSELKLAGEWGWNRKTVHSYLNLLKKLKMVTTVGTTKGTTITIENYGEYQGEGTMVGTAVGTLKGQRRDNEAGTNKNIKNDKECKEDIYSNLPVEIHGPLKRYIEMRKGMGKQKAMSDHAVKLLIGKLNKLAPTNISLQIAMLEEATMKNWLSVYLPKPEQSSNPFKDKLKEMMQDEQSRDNSPHVGYQGGLSKLLQEPNRD